MLLNNLDAEVAERPEDLVVYGGTGRAARSHERAEGDRPRAARPRRRRDAARPVGQAGRGLSHDAAVAARADRELAARAEVGDVGRVPAARGGGADDVRPDDRGLVDLHRHAGNPAGHVPDVRRRGPEALRRRRRSRAGRSSPRGSAGWAARSRWPATLAGAAILCVEVDPTRIERRLETRYLDEATDSLDDALARVRAAARRRPRALGRTARERRRRRSRARAARRALRSRHRPDRGARSADRLRPAGAVTSPRRPRCARPIRTSTCAARARRSRRTSRGCSSTSGPGAMFSIMATTCEVRPKQQA